MQSSSKISHGCQVLYLEANSYRHLSLMNTYKLRICNIFIFKQNGSYIFQIYKIFHKFLQHFKTDDRQIKSCDNFYEMENQNASALQSLNVEL